MFTCGCGKECKSEVGFSLHQKGCPEAKKKNRKPTKQEPETEPDPEVETSTEEEDIPKRKKAVQYLTTTDRNAFAKMILRRKDTILSLLGEEMGKGTEALEGKLRQEHGITIGADDVRSLIKELDGQIDEALERHTNSEKARIEVSRAEISDEFDEKAKEMKERHRAELAALVEQKDAKLKQLQDEFRNIKERVLRENISELNTRREQYNVQLLSVREAEERVKQELARRASFISQSKGRIMHVVEDAANRAQEQVWVVETREEATALLDRIPTVEEAIEMCQSPESMTQLFRRLCPTMTNRMLPPPPPEAKDIITVEVQTKDVEDEGEDEEEDEDYEEEEEEVGADHVRS